MLRVAEKYSDEALVSEISKGKDINPAIRFLYHDHSSSVSAFIISKGGSSQDAEDIFQEAVVAFINIVQKGKFRREASVRTFLISVAKNIWYNELKKRQNSENRERIFESEKDTVEADISEQIGDREMKKQFRVLLDRLGDPCRKLLLLFYYENHTMKEMLQHLPYENEQVMRNKKYKCLKQLTHLVTQDPLIKTKIK
ncbi:MAG: sigma-70 family RNA polymerase sigma factor [Chitinophagaceae bacterium]|nr:MAG: sigma-70 family RNA polymerase sigma factor [Chitinophagaceae bacterium]